MKSQKTINLLEKTSDNKDLLQKRINKKKITVITKKLRCQTNNLFHHKP